ncbi:MAG: class I SAM-dependent methyltransferase [Candidatus Atribacteria bacterium]|nr:class I SAM-dependent methyltransferase [Candidatus Atribacteria bacterium]
MLPYQNLVTLYEQVVFCEKNKIEGDYVECGVWKDGAVGLMALANLKYGAGRRKLHLFDAFEEICAPNEELDGERAIEEVKQSMGNNAPVKGELVPLKGIYDRFGGPGDINECKHLIEQVIGYDKELVNYHKGWFQDTVPQASGQINKIAILRLDGDYYESTKICLNYLYDKVVPNGFIIIDDYGVYSGCQKAVKEFFVERNISVFLNYSSWACRYFTKK